MGKKSVTSQSTLSFGTEGKFLDKVQDAYDKMFMGVLYTMVHGNTFSKKFIMLNVGVEFLQLLSFCFRAMFPWQHDLKYLGLSLSFLSLPGSLFSYFSYTVVYWLVFLFVWLSLGNAILVGYGFHNESVRFIFPIRTLRWFTSILVSALYIPVVVILLISLSCDSSTSSAVLSTFPKENIMCYGVDNLVKYVVSITTLLAFTPFAVANCSTYYESDPSVKSTFGRAHSRFELGLLFIKTLWTFTFNFLDDYPWLLCFLIFIFIFVATAANAIYMPYYNSRLNQVRTGLFSVVCWTSVILIICMAINNPHNPAPTWLFVAGIIPSFLLGWYLHGKREKYLRLAASELIAANAGVDMEMAVKITDNKGGPTVRWGNDVRNNRAIADAAMKSIRFVTDVEITTRFLLSGTITSDSLTCAELLYRAGLKKFPRSAFVLMAYINFLMVYKKEKQRGFALLDKLRKLTKPWFDVRFFIFRQDKEREREVQLQGIGQHSEMGDFVGYMQFEKLYTQARNSHIETLELVKKFWKLLLEDDVDMAKLAAQAGKIASAEEKAEKLYKSLLNLYPNSPRLLRDFAQFVDDILQEDELVRLLVERADKLEDTASKSKSRTPRDNDSDGDKELDELGWDASQSSFTNDMSNGTFQKRKLKLLSKKGNSQLRILSWVLILTTGFAILMGMVMAIVIAQQFNLFSGALLQQKVVVVLNEAAADAQTNTRMAVVLTKNLGINSSSVGADSIQGVLDKNMRIGITMKNTMQALLWDQGDVSDFFSDHYKQIAGSINTSMDIGSRVFTFSEYNISRETGISSPEITDLWYNPTINTTQYLFKDSSTFLASQVVPWGLWNAGRYLADCVITLAGKTVDQLAAAHYSSEFVYVTYNAAYSITDGLRQLLVLSGDRAIEKLQNIRMFGYIFYSFICFAVLCAGLFVFRPVTKKVVNQKMATLNLFLLVPRHIVLKMSRKRTKLQSLSREGDLVKGSDEEEYEFDEDDYENQQQQHLQQLQNQPSNTQHNIIISADPIVDPHPNMESVQIDCTVTPNTSTPPIQINLATNNLLSNSQTTIETLSNSTTVLLPNNNNSNNNLNQQYVLVNNQQQNIPINNNYNLPNNNNYNNHYNQQQQQQQQQDEPEETATLLSKVFGKNNKKTTTTTKGYKHKSAVDKDHNLAKGFRWLHISYTFGLFLIILLVTSFVVALTLACDNLRPAVPAITTVADRARLVATSRAFAMEFALSPAYAGKTNQTIEVIRKTVTELYNAQQNCEKLLDNTIDSPEMLNDMYGSGCMRWNKETCLTSADPWYGAVSKGSSHLITEYITALNTLIYTKLYETPNPMGDPILRFINEVASNDLYDTVDRMNLLMGEYWLERVSYYNRAIGIVAAVMCLLFVIEYIVYFRPLLKRLENESQNTLAMLQMIPKKELKEIKEIREALEASQN